jgi:hypothetical protein
MPQYADIYIAVKTRSKEKAIEFLNYFLPDREESADEYEFPQYERKDEYEFENVLELMSFLEENTNSEYNIYWRNTDEQNPNRHGMLFYTKDEAIIFGISRNADINGPQNSENEDICLKKMKAYFKTNIGYIAYEDEVAHETYEEFMRAVNKSSTNE